MRNKISLALFAAAWIGLLSAPLGAVSQDFEGKVDFKVTAEEKDAPRDFSYFVKGTNVRIEWQPTKKDQQPAPIIIDGGKKTMTIVMPAEKQYMQMPMQEAEEAAQEAAKQDKREFQKTGRTETILGYPSQQWISKDENGETEIWATDKLGYFSGFRSSKQKAHSEWQKQLMKAGFFPLKVHERTAAGKEKSSWEVTKIEKKSLPKDLFQPPADYTKLEMPQMPQMKDFKNMFKKGMIGGREN